ncbi:terpene synthase family protein [Chitinophaga varians]|uniref:terpene synthase family protein n=1 Tax=Chitinophaga varians TaxID=2202339 RepID=UPI00165F77D8|nr:hypothetical protein [Chitinophaga varians]MBC9914359.1 hypothetical protein [Chitinophaga varians]
MQSLLAELQYPFPSRIHPDHALIEKEVHAFIDSYTSLSPEARQQFKAAGFGRLTVLWFPDSPLRQLIPLARLLTWTFIFDDVGARWPLPQLKGAHDRLTAILRGSPSYPGEDAMFQQFAMVYEELACHLLPQAWMTRYIASWQYFFEGQLLEKQYSYKHDLTYPSLAAYLDLREKLGAAYPFIDLVEVTSGFMLPPEVFGHPAIQQRRFFVSRLTTWDNDLLSFEKEQRSLEAMNLVAVIRHEHNCLLQEAYNIALRMRDEQVEAYLHLCAHWPNFGEHREAVAAYALRLDWLISGHLEWYRDNPRYQ